MIGDVDIQSLLLQIQLLMKFPMVKFVGAFGLAVYQNMKLL